MIRSAFLALAALPVPVHAESAEADRDRSVDLAATLYYTALEADYPRGSAATFRDRYGNVLRRGSEEFLAAAAIEGTAEFADGTVLNYAVRIEGEVRWVEVEEGLDARGCSLIPFRSTAVDPELVPLGTLLHIKETVGMPLPDGGRHDGTWIAADTGPSITGNRIDLYTGRGMSSMDVVAGFGIGHLQELSVELRESHLPCPSESWPQLAGSLVKADASKY